MADNAGVESPPPLLQETAIGHLVGQGMLEGVCEFGEEAGFVEEFSGLQVAERGRSSSSDSSPMACKRAKGTSVPITRRSLEETLLRGRQAVDAGRQDGLHGGGDLQALQGLCQARGAALTDQHPGFPQAPDALLQEKRVALGARDQHLSQGLEGRSTLRPSVVPQEGLQEFLGARRGQGVEPQLGVGGLVPPVVLVLRAVVNEQEQAGGRQALDQAVEDRLGLGVDPVQVLDDQEQRPHLLSRRSRPLMAS